MKHPIHLFFKGDKVDLIELLYALHHSGVIPKTSAENKATAPSLEQIFTSDFDKNKKE